MAEIQEFENSENYNLGEENYNSRRNRKRKNN